MADQATQSGDLHPDEYTHDLRPDPTAGMNTGPEGQHPEKAGSVDTAYDIKNLHRRLQSLTDDELKGIPVLPVGSRLEQGATYIDLREDEPSEFTARGDMEVAPDNWYVPKSEVDYQLWNRLIGVDNPERLGEADED